jgi:hypothetical protein
MMDKVRMILTSFRVLRYGCLSLVPILGLGFALVTFYHFTRVFYFTKEDWNPARSHLYWGAGIALASSLLHALALTLPLIYFMQQ